MFWWILPKRLVPGRKLALFKENSIFYLFVFLRGNRALAENVAPIPLEMHTFYNVSGLPSHMPPLFVECSFYVKCMHFLET